MEGVTLTSVSCQQCARDASYYLAYNWQKLYDSHRFEYVAYSDSQSIGCLASALLARSRGVVDCLNAWDMRQEKYTPTMCVIMNAHDFVCSMLAPLVY